MGHSSPESDQDAEIKRRIVALAEEMLAGRISYFDGATKIVELRFPIRDLPERDPDFDVFELIRSETDHLPMEAQRPLWSAEALRGLADEYRRTEEWAAEFAPDACRRLIARFRPHDG